MSIKQTSIENIYEKCQWMLVLEILGHFISVVYIFEL